MIGVQGSRNRWYIEGLSACLYMDVPLHCARVYQAMVQDEFIEAKSRRDMEAFSFLKRQSMWVGKQVPASAAARTLRTT